MGKRDLKKKNYRSLLPPINNSESDQEESQFCNVKANDKHKGGGGERLRSYLLTCIIYSKSSPIYLN